MIDPIRFRRILINLLKAVAVLELLGAFFQGTSGGGWHRLGADLLVAGILYLAWERLASGLDERKERYRRKITQTTQKISLRDAIVFSLLASDEIFSGIPEDRRRLVVTAYTLIALGLVAAFAKIGPGLMPLVVSGAILLGGVNLLAWIVSEEREVRESLETELKLAHDVQMSLMPREQPKIPGFDIAGMSTPAKEVGGDFYDYSTLGEENGPLGIAVLDVSGKGIQAAMSAVFTSGAYASETRLSTSPAAILTRLNRSVARHSQRGHFVAFLLVALDPSSGRFVYANAGQTRPMHISNGVLTTLNSVGVHFPLGMRADTAYEEQEMVLQPGDTVVMLTDGFTDAMNSGEEQFGIERIEQLLQDPSLAHASAQEIIARLSSEVGTFAGGTAQHDDMTIVVLKRVG